MLAGDCGGDRRGPPNDGDDDSRIDLPRPDCLEIWALLNSCNRNDGYLRDLIDEATTACGSSPHFECGGDGCTGHHNGYTCCSTNVIHLCPGSNANCGTLRHELVHVRQNCEQQWGCDGCQHNVDSCDMCCNEIEAYTAALGDVWCASSQKSKYDTIYFILIGESNCRRCMSENPARWFRMFRDGDCGAACAQ